MMHVKRKSEEEEVKVDEDNIPVKCFSHLLQKKIVHFKKNRWSQFSWSRRVKSSLSCSGSDPGRLPGYSQSKSSPSKSNLERPICWSFDDSNIGNHICYVVIVVSEY